MTVPRSAVKSCYLAIWRTRSKSIKIGTPWVSSVGFLSHNYHDAFLRPSSRRPPSLSRAFTSWRDRAYISPTIARLLNSRCATFSKQTRHSSACRCLHAPIAAQTLLQLHVRDVATSSRKGKKENSRSSWLNIYTVRDYILIRTVVFE